MKVLLVRLSAMGDLVQSLGAVRELVRARPDDEFWMVTQGAWAPLLSAVPGVRIGVVTHDRAAGWRGVLATGKVLRDLRFDVALDLQGNWKAAGLAWLSRARRRVGLAKGARREPGSAWLLTEKVGAAPRAHPADGALAVVRALAPEAGGGVGRVAPRLEVGADIVAAERRALAALGVDPSAPFRVLVLGVAGDNRAWPVAAMAREVVGGAGAPMVCVAGPAERGVDGPAGVPVLRHGAGEVLRLVALGALCAEADGVVVGPDMGATHVLAAAGARVVGMFGPQDPARTAPVAAEILVRGGGPACVPCRSRRCAHPEGPVCMDFTVAEGQPWSGG